MIEYSAQCVIWTRNRELTAHLPYIPAYVPTKAALGAGAIGTMEKLLYMFHPASVTCIVLCSGVFIARGKETILVTQSIVPGEAVYGEKKVSVEVSCLSVCRMYMRHVWYVWHQVCLCGDILCV